MTDKQFWGRVSEWWCGEKSIPCQGAALWLPSELGVDQIRTAIPPAGELVLNEGAHRWVVEGVRLVQNPTPFVKITLFTATVTTVASPFYGLGQAMLKDEQNQKKRDLEDRGIPLNPQTHLRIRFPNPLEWREEETGLNGIMGLGD